MVASLEISNDWKYRGTGTRAVENEEEPPSELEEQFILYEMKKIQVKISRLPNKERDGQLENMHLRRSKRQSPELESA